MKTFIGPKSGCVYDKPLKNMHHIHSNNLYMFELLWVSLTVFTSNSLVERDEQRDQPKSQTFNAYFLGAVINTTAYHLGRF